MPETMLSALFRESVFRKCAEVAGVWVQAGMKGIEVPRSIPKLTTRRVLTMSFVAGDPITRLKVPCCPLPRHKCSTSSTHTSIRLGVVSPVRA